MDLTGRLSLSELASQLQARSSSPIPRLGLPAFYWGTNQIHGIAGSHCRPSGRCPVSWPDGVAMAASFNATAWRLLGRTAGIEMRALYNLLFSESASPALGLTSWGPTVNILRDTRWGRSQEAASEDPFLAGEYGAAISSGLQQGDDPRGFLLAVSGLKHFAAYSLEQYGPPTNPTEWTRQTFNAKVSKFDERDTYFRPFQASIQKGGAAGIMYAANEFNGIPGCLSDYLRVALEGWGFDGYRCTDGGQIQQAVDLHKFVPTLDQAIAFAAVAQSDIADGIEYADDGLMHAFITGNVTLEQARTLARNSLRVRFRLGLFEWKDPPYAHFGEADVGAPAAWDAAKLASREGLVLLANKGDRVLPLVRGAKWSRPGSLAVIGPQANNTLLLQGNYGGAFCPLGPHGLPSTDCFPSIFTALQNGYAPGAVYAQGSYVNSSDAGLLASAVAAAKTSDAVVLCLGLDQTLEREQLDRYTVTLPLAQQELFAAIASVLVEGGAPLLVVLVHGGFLAAREVKAGADALIDALYPGVRGGEAIADALFGAFSPGGKMPYTTYPPEYATMYNFTSMDIAAPQTYVDSQGRNATTPGGRTYRYYTGTDELEALWPFGWGLSYTRFSLDFSSSPPPTQVTLTPSSSSLSFTVNLTNVGACAGDEVVLLFAQPIPGTFSVRPPPFSPVRSLVGFSRASLLPGAHTSLSFNLSALEAFASTQEDGSRAPIDGGKFILNIGTGPAHPEVSLNLTVILLGWI